MIQIQARLPQIILIGSFLGFCWLALQVAHELGHVLGAWLSGGTVTGVALHPLTFSRTDLGQNPNPGVVVWAGPIVGVLLPLATFSIARLARWPGLYLFRFFAGFCLVANGVYIGAGWLIEEGADAFVMLFNGSPKWALILFGTLTVPIGLLLWHRQGRHFGLGSAQGKVNARAVLASALLFLGVAGLEFLFGHR